MAHRRAHHLERCHPRRAARPVRRPEARRARGRRRADPEPRHARRQHLHGLAGRRRRAQPAGARCEYRAGKPARPALSADGRLHRRLSPYPMPPRRDRHGDPRAQAEHDNAQPFPQARRAQVSGDLDRDGRQVSSRSIRRTALQQRASPSAPARPCPSVSMLWKRLWSRSRRDGCGPGCGLRTLRSSRPSTTSADRRPTGARRRWR